MSENSGPRPVFRLGDMVRLVDPRPVVRVGYDVDVDKLEEEASQDPLVEAFVSHLGLDRRARRRIYRAVACGRMAKHKVDGTKRRVHFGDPVPGFQDRLFEVVGKSVKMTGDYVSAWPGSPDECYADCQPAYLSLPKAVVLLEIREAKKRRPGFMTLVDPADVLTVSAGQVEKQEPTP